MTNKSHSRGVTQEQYQAAIPGCCRLRTFEEHAEIIMLCWGLTRQIQTRSAKSPCGMCEYNVEPAGAAMLLEWHEEQSKKRVWKTLGGRNIHNELG